MYRSSNNSRCETTRHGIRHCGARRRGSLLVLFALLMVVFLGLLGLVIDGAMLMANYRQAQNAADAAAMAAAYHRMRGYTISDSTAVAVKFVQEYNGLTTSAATSVRIPPTTGPYAGNSTYVEVVIDLPCQTSFIQVLGVNRNQTVQGRAVAGYEPRSAGEGVITLDPTARPGLSVSGSAALRVGGRVAINSEGGGVDENGVAVNNGSNGVAASGGNANADAGVFATAIDVVGGVDKPSSFKAYITGDPSPLICRQVPEPDPLLLLPTPTTSTGVNSTIRGSIDVTNTSVKGISEDTGHLNFVALGGEYVANWAHRCVKNEVILYPGIYRSISITGGTVYMVPGIYVLAPDKNTTNTLKITGGTVVARGILFYNTASTYNSVSGAPDVNDLEDNSALGGSEYAGGFALTTGAYLTPIDTSTYNYPAMYSLAPSVSPMFNGMLFYQRRRNTNPMQITGSSSAGQLTGTLYAKWANFQLSGQGTFDAQFIVGSIALSGQGNVTILGSGSNKGRANQLFLVE